MLYVLRALTPWKYVICVTNAAFVTKHCDVVVFPTWIYYYTIVKLVFVTCNFCQPFVFTYTMYYCPLLSVSVSSHYTGDVIVIYVILMSWLIYIRVHNSMAADTTLLRTFKSQVPAQKICRKQNTSTIYCHVEWRLPFLQIGWKQ